jgi:hypothetical protein
MTEQQKVRCFGSVDRPYESVRDALHGLVFPSGAATQLHVHSICDREKTAGLPSVTRIAMGWDVLANASTSLTVTSAEIYASPLSPSDTQLEIEGHCSALHEAGDDARPCVAEAWIHALLAEIIESLRRAC